MAIDPSILELEVAGHTDPGKVRDNNEDQFLIAHLVTSLRVQQTSLPPEAIRPYIPPSGILIVVSDGMGGHEGGEVASALAVQTVRDAVESVLRYRARPRAGQSPTSLEETFLEAFERAQQVVRARAEAEQVRANMGATLTAAYIEEGRMLIAHAGDSRAYLLREGRLRQLTTDHTLAEALRSAGAITDTQAIRHHGRHILTNALGTNQEIDVETMTIDLQPDDRVLLMTDGCCGPLKKARITELAADGTPEEVCLRLCEKAIEEGGTDNVTVVCLRAFLPPPVPMNPVAVPQSVPQQATPPQQPAAPPPTQSPGAGEAPPRA